MMPDQAVEDFEAEFYIDGIDATSEPPEVTTEVSTEFAEQVQESARARSYRKKVSRGLGHLWRPLLQDPNTINDAATILNYGPDFARAVGDLADRDIRARKVIDFVTDGADNPYINVAVTLVPLVAQLMRNHEDKLDVSVHMLRIPFTKRGIRVKFGLKLGRFRNMTYEPSYLTRVVLSNPKLVETLNKQGINIAWSNATADANGNGTGKPRRFRKAG